MGAAPMAYALWTGAQPQPGEPEMLQPLKSLRALSGHGLMLLYSLLHLDRLQEASPRRPQAIPAVGLQDAGPPKPAETPGVEVTTPARQGLRNRAWAGDREAHIGPASSTGLGVDLVDHFTYVIMGDGCHQRAGSSEAPPWPPPWGPGQVDRLYDDNHITHRWATPVSPSPRGRLKRYEAYGWHVQARAWQKTTDDVAAITQAIESPRPGHDSQPDQGDHHDRYGSPNKATPRRATAPHSGADEAELTRRRWSGAYGKLRVAPAGLRPLGAKQSAAAGRRAEWTANPATYRSSTQLKRPIREDARGTCPRAGKRRCRPSTPS